MPSTRQSLQAVKKSSRYLNGSPSLQLPPQKFTAGEMSLRPRASAAASTFGQSLAASAAERFAWSPKFGSLKPRSALELGGAFCCISTGSFLAPQIIGTYSIPIVVKTSRTPVSGSKAQLYHQA